MINGKRELVKVYKTGGRLLTREAREQAEKLDKFLEEKMKEIEEEMRRGGYLQLKGRSGVIKLWYEVGRRLNSFVANPEIVPAEDREYVWRALYDYGGELVPGTGRSRAESKRNHFRYCYEIAKFDRDFVLGVGNWRMWSEILDSVRIYEDHRILQWLHQRLGENPREWMDLTRKYGAKWFRELAKRIRNYLRGRDTSVLDQKRLFSELDGVLTGLTREA